MSERAEHDRAFLREFAAPEGVTLRPWEERDFPAIQALSAAQRWFTPLRRPEESLAGWRASWPAIVAEADGQLVGFIRALSDGVLTTYVAGLLVAPVWRGHGLGRALMEACHGLTPGARLDLLADPEAVNFYTHLGYRPYAGFRRRRRG